MVVHPKSLWAAYGPTDGALTLETQGILHGLQGRPELNGEVAKLLKWDGPAGRFAVEIKSTGECVKVKPVNLKSEVNSVDGSLFCVSENHMGQLDMHMEATVASFLKSHAVGILSTASRALRAALWLETTAEPLWEGLTVQRYGRKALDVVCTACPSAGPPLYRRARSLRHIFRGTVQVMPGSVCNFARDFEVVASPTLRNPGLNARIGAQGAVRDAGGMALEVSIASLSVPLPELSTTLVPCGRFAQRVAMVVTEVPSSVLRQTGNGTSTLEAIVDWILRLHANLLRTVRNAGYRSVVMPTLATGGMGMPAHIVAMGAMQAIHRDLLDHPADPMHVGVACFEPSHIPAFNLVKDELFENFYMPEEAVERLTSAMLESTNVGRM